MSFFSKFLQNVIESTLNSSTANLAGGASFTGTADSTLGVAGIQVSLYTDQNCTVYIEQSPDTTPTGPHWDLSDEYRYFADTNFGVTVQAISSYFRVRVANSGIVPTNYFRLQSVLCPIVEVVPRTLTEFGSLKTAVVENVASTCSGNCKTNLTGSQEWEGSWQEVYNQSAIQLIAKFDQDYTVYIDQGQDGTTADITDTWTALANEGFSISVASIAPYFKVRVTNGSASAATGKLTTAATAIFNPLPRKLDEHGHLETSVNHIKDGYGFQLENTPMGEMRTVIPVRLIGSTFDSATLDTNFWTSTAVSGGTSTPTSGALLLSTNTTANGAITVNSLRRARYVAGSSLRFRTQLLLSAAVTNNKRRWGIAYGSTMPTITDGAYFELNGATFSIVTLRDGVETRVSSGNFNGSYGPNFTVGTANRSYEIYWTNGKVYFVIADTILHTVTASTTTWSITMSHYIFLDNVNSSGISSNSTIECRVASIYRLGNITTQPTHKYQSGTTAGVICKYSIGNLNQAIISNVTNNSVITIYDGTTTGGTIIWSSGTMTAQTTPFDLDFKNLPFHTGLFFTITGANCNLLLIYE